MNYGYGYGYGLPEELELTLHLLLEVIYANRKILQQLFFAIQANNYALVSSILSTLSLDLQTYRIITYLMNYMTGLLQFNVKAVQNIIPQPVAQAFNKYGIKNVIVDYVG